MLPNIDPIVNETKPEPSLTSTLFSLTLARLMLNGARRFPYLILTPMAASLGVPRATLEATLSILWATGAVSPVSGAFLDRIGRKRMMLIGIGSLAIFAGIAAIAQNVSVVLFAIVAGGVAKVFYDPAMQAYIGDRTPYEKRGMAIGITELSWSGSLFILGPLAAFLIVNVSLGAIYAVIAAGSLLSFFLILKVIQQDTAANRSVGTIQFSAYRNLFKNRGAVALLLTACLISIALDLPTIAYESWLRNAFNLTTIIIGSLAWVFGTAEVIGEFLVIGIADRFGKKRLTVLAILLTGVIYLLLPLASVFSSSILAVILLFCMYFCFEISVVSIIPLATEAAPTARGTMMSMNIAFFSAGHAIGTFIGGTLFRVGGMSLVGVIAMVLSTAGAALIWRFVEHR